MPKEAQKTLQVGKSESVINGKITKSKSRSNEDFAYFQNDLIDTTLLADSTSLLMMQM